MVKPHYQTILEDFVKKVDQLYDELSGVDTTAKLDEFFVNHNDIEEYLTEVKDILGMKC